MRVNSIKAKCLLLPRKKIKRYKESNEAPSIGTSLVKNIDKEWGFPHSLSMFLQVWKRDQASKNRVPSGLFLLRWCHLLIEVF